MRRFFADAFYWIALLSPRARRFLKRTSRVFRSMGRRSMIITSTAPRNGRYEAVLRRCVLLDRPLESPSSEIPEEDLARLPVDGAAQHDRYIYGTPKRTL